MNSDERILELPQPIIDRLREVIGRIRRLQWVKGSLLTLAALVVGLLAVAGLDAAFSLESVPLRIALSLVALAFTLAVAWTQWLRPLSRRISLTAVARWVETRHPELQERISTAVELLGDRHGESGRESRELLEEVVKDAVADVGRMDPAQDLGPRRTRPAKWIAGGALALLAVLAALWPHQIPRLLARALVPTAQVGNAWADRLRVIVPQSIVAIGDPLDIQVALRGSKDRVELQMTPQGGTLVVESLPADPTVPTQEGESGYSLRIPAVKETFTARVIAGKAVSAPFTVTAVPRPEAGPWTMTYQYPAYTGLKDSVQENAPGEIAALAGTRVTLQAPLNRAVEKAVVKIAGTDTAPPTLTFPPADPAISWSTVLPPDLDATWTLNLEGAHAIANHPVALPIRSFKDLPPVITLDSPAEDRLELRPVEKLPLAYSVREDIALSTVAIRVRPQDKPEYYLPGENLAALVEEAPGEFRGTAVLDLSKILVPDNGEIRVSLMAADKVPAEMQGPQRAFSREIVIRLNKWTRPLVEQNFQAQHEELRKKMEDVKRELQSAKGRMNDKPDRLRQDEKLSENTLKDIEASSRHMETAQALMEELTARMKETAYARQTPELENIANNMVQPARDQTREIPLTDQKQARSDLAKNSKDLLENAIQKLEAEQRQMDQDREAVQQVAKLSDIAEQQQKLAREAADAASPAANQAQVPPNAAQAPPPAQAPNPGNPSAPSPANPADPNAADPSQQTAANAAQPPAAPPTDEEQRKWLEEQRRVAERAKQLMQENQNRNPQALGEELKQAAARAAELSAAAAELAKKEHAAAAEISQAATPESRRQEAADQQALAAEVAALQEKARQFQEGSAKQIDQSTETQEAAHESRSNLGDAARQASQSSQELAAAAAPQPAPATGSTPAPATPPTPAPASADAANPDKSSAAPPAPADPAAPNAPAAAAPNAVAATAPNAAAAPSPTTPSSDPNATPAAAAPAPAPGQSETAAANANANTPPPESQAAATPTPTAPPGTGLPASSADSPAAAAAPATPATPAIAGQEAARDSAKSLEEAAAALAALNKELNALAGMVADHNQSLGEGAQQAGTAVDQAAKAQNEGGKAPSMQQGAQAAQAAADQLAMAANTAMEAMSIPSSAKSSQPSTAQSKGEGQSQSGQPDPAGGNGKDGKSGLQMDTANGELPPELAKLGLSEADWVKLRSSLQGVDGTRGTEVPAEYRDLVKAYFGAISKGGIAK